MPETQAQQAFNLARSCVAWNDPSTPTTRHANQHVERRTYGDGSRLTLWADGMVEWQEKMGDRGLFSRLKTVVTGEVHL